VGNADVINGNGFHVFTCLFDTFAYGFRYLICFAKTITNTAIAITDNNDCTKAETPTTLNNFSYPVDVYYLFNKLIINLIAFKIGQLTPPTIPYD